MHIGIVDGALLAWVCESGDQGRREFSPALRFLALQQILFAVVGSLIAAILLRENTTLRFVAFGTLGLAVVFNAAALFQSALQALRQFFPVALATVAPVGIFVAISFLWSRWWAPDFRVLIVSYCLSWTAVLIFLYGTG